MLTDDELQDLARTVADLPPEHERIIIDRGTLPLQSENADDAYTVEDLVPHGWAPGGYIGPVGNVRSTSWPRSARDAAVPAR